MIWLRVEHCVKTIDGNLDCAKECQRISTFIGILFVATEFRN